MTQTTIQQKIDRLVNQHVLQHQGDWFNEDRVYHEKFPEGVLLLRRSGVEYFSGHKSKLYEMTTFDYYERIARNGEGDYHYYQVTERSVRRIDLERARKLFNQLVEKNYDIAN